MNDNIVFKNKEELYNRVYPALYSKAKEIRKLGFKYIKEIDIWNYLVDSEWKKRNDLELHDLISDILYVDNERLKEYVMEKINKIKDDVQIKDINNNVNDSML